MRAMMMIRRQMIRTQMIRKQRGGGEQASAGSQSIKGCVFCFVFGAEGGWCYIM